MPTLIFHGHACWEVQGEHRLLIDPFLAGNPVADVGPEHFDTLDAILLSHGHVDHIGDTEAIARATGALIVANYEIASHFGDKAWTPMRCTSAAGAGSRSASSSSRSPTTAPPDRTARRSAALAALSCTRTASGCTTPATPACSWTCSLSPS